MEKTGSARMERAQAGEKGADKSNTAQRNDYVSKLKRLIFIQPRIYNQIRSDYWAIYQFIDENLCNLFHNYSCVCCRYMCRLR